MSFLDGPVTLHDLFILAVVLTASHFSKWIAGIGLAGYFFLIAIGRS